jgi:serine/threonine-protein kinase
MVAASLLLMLGLIGLSLWLAVQQAHRRDSVDAELRDAAGLQESSRWAEARASLDRADRLNESWPHALRGRIAQARRDLDLMIKLDTIRVRRVTRGELVFYRTQSDREYRDAFPEARLGTVRDPPQRVAARINASTVRSALVAALLDWAVCASDHEQRAWLLDVVRRTESDTDDWRRRALDPSTWEKPEALDALAKSAPAAGQSVSLLLALGERLKILGADSVPLLTRVQKANPADFWANLMLGNAVLQRLPQEAAGYYRAALASRPGTAVGYCAVGDALRLQNLIGDAIDYYKSALQLDSDYSRAHSDLGLALQAQDRLDQAIDCYRKALQCDPDYGWAHYNLANALRVQGRIDEAYDHYRQVIRVDPKNSEVQLRLASILVPQGRGPEVQAGWHSALDANPHGYAAWSGYAELCLFLGQEDEYCRARGALLDRFGATTDAYVAEPVGRACLLRPGKEDELQKSVALTDRALAAHQSTPAWIYRYFRFAHGLAEYRRGRLESAIAVMEGEASQVMGPSPRLVIAMAQYGQGQPARACKTLATAIIVFDWSAVQADTRDIWICHILRREAEALILPSLPKFLRGEYQPQENDERLGLVGICQSQGLYHAAARLYADAFAADPDLAEKMTAAYRTRATLEYKQSVGRLEELITEGRYLAARCAALAGCGLGADGAKLDEAQRSRWRRQASDWLRAELAVCATALDNGPPAVRAQVRRMLAKWRLDPDLAGLCESNALDQLPADERKEYLALWQAVGELLGRARADQ